MNFAIIPAFGSLPHQWLGPYTVLQRLLLKLAQSRSIEGFTFVTDADHAECMRGFPCGEDRIQEVLVLTPEATLFQLCRAVHAGHYEGYAKNNYVICNPLYPFVAGSKYDYILDQLAEASTSLLTPGGGSFGYNTSGAFMTPIGTYVEAGIAVRAEVFNGSMVRNKIVDLGDKFTLLPMTPLECISIDTDEGMQLAEAAVIQGLV